MSASTTPRTSTRYSRLHDLDRDEVAKPFESFRQRSLRNFENRGLHHHVFDTRLAVGMVDRAGLEMTFRGPFAALSHHGARQKGPRRPQRVVLGASSVRLISGARSRPTWQQAPRARAHRIEEARTAPHATRRSLRSLRRSRRGEALHRRPSSKGSARSARASSSSLHRS